MVWLPGPGVDPAASLTAPALPQVTPGPTGEHVELRLKRAVAPTCGYISGDTASPMTCRTSFFCTTGIWGEFGCGNQLENDTGYHDGCVDATHQKCEIQGYEFGCAGRTSILTCPNACITHLLKQPGAYSTATHTSWSCGVSESTRIALATPTNGDGSGGGDGNENGNGLATPTVQFPGLLPTTDTGNGGSGSTNGNTGNSNNSPLGSPSPPSLAPGAIAGIAIGSALGALLIAGIVWFAVRNRPKKAPPNYSQTVVSGWLDQAH